MRAISREVECKDEARELFLLASVLRISLFASNRTAKLACKKNIWLILAVSSLSHVQFKVSLSMLQSVCLDMGGAKDCRDVETISSLARPEKPIFLRWTEPLCLRHCFDLTRGPRYSLLCLFNMEFYTLDWLGRPALRP